MSWQFKRSDGKTRRDKKNRYATLYSGDKKRGNNGVKLFVNDKTNNSVDSTVAKIQRKIQEKKKK